MGGESLGRLHKRETGAVEGRELHSRVCGSIVYLGAGGLWCSYAILIKPTKLYEHHPNPKTIVTLTLHRYLVHATALRRRRLDTFQVHHVPIIGAGVA